MLGIGTEAIIFLCAALSGIIVRSAYEILRLLRRLIVHNIFVINLEDFFFWVSTSVYLFRQMYHMTYGNIRWFFIIGVILGSFFVEFIFLIAKKP